MNKNKNKNPLFKDMEFDHNDKEWAELLSTTRAVGLTPKNKEEIIFGNRKNRDKKDKLFLGVNLYTKDQIKKSKEILIQTKIERTLMFTRLLERIY